MKERPILFSGPMVRAILDGRKTMTRRVVRFNAPREDCPWCGGKGNEWIECDNELSGYDYRYNCRCMYPKSPCGQPGDRLWVRETWAIGDRDGDVVYAADKEWHINGVAIGPRCNRGTRWEDCWRPSIHMPRWASRIDLEITDIRAERLQDITEEDAKAEGAERLGNYGDEWTAIPEGTFRIGYRALWDSLNAKRGYGWDMNPWVWVITFRGAA